MVKKVNVLLLTESFTVSPRGVQTQILPCLRRCRPSLNITAQTRVAIAVTVAVAAVHEFEKSIRKNVEKEHARFTTIGKF
ncbi:hypothetical protein L596_004544 [Steinernema carpocapsae]|uniref:Uncharacterized protein n=1 Tax=Steinernema carpocapsae TaxID=34508 RepID=A0A4U8UW92_STECR|nr:hypothetical protein L596_004544 [Steinernema carpocapsae]